MSIRRGSFYGADGDRTHHLKNAILALYQMSYGPEDLIAEVVGI